MLIPYQIRKCLITLRAHTHKPINLYCFSSNAVHRSQSPLGAVSASVSDYLMTQHHFSPATALKASSAVHFLKNPQRIDSVFKYLQETGFSTAQIETIVNKYPRALSIHLDTIERKLKIFHGFGFSPSETVDVVSHNPWMLSCFSEGRLHSTLAVLETVLGSTDPVRRLLSKSCNWSMRGDRVVANVEYLNRTCGICPDQIRTYLVMNPRLFVRSPESLAELVRRVDETGFGRNSRSFLKAIQVMSSQTVEVWELKLRFFRELGLLQDQVWSMFRRAPTVFCLSVENIKEKMDAMVEYGKIDISYVVQRPELIGYDVVRRVKPRLDVMEVLEKQDLIKTRPKLTTIITMPREKFLEKYVVPYLDAIPLPVVKKL